jgi:hypothetical protein
MKIKLKKNMSFGFGWALPTLPPLTSRHWSERYLAEILANEDHSGKVTKTVPELM